MNTGLADLTGPNLWGVNGCCEVLSHNPIENSIPGWSGIDTQVGQIGYMEDANKYGEPSPLPHQALPKVLRKDEVNRLIRCCDPVEKVIIELYLRTGLRVSEGLHLRIRDINFHDKDLFVSRGKRNKDRVVPFDSALKDILQRYVHRYHLAGEDFLFSVKKWAGSAMLNRRTYKKTPNSYTDYKIYKLVRKLADKAGLQERTPGTGSSPQKTWSYRVHPHLLRHSGLTFIQESCGDPFITKEIAGHSSLAMTEIYVHLAMKKKQEAVEKAFRQVRR